MTWKKIYDFKIRDRKATPLQVQRRIIYSWCWKTHLWRPTCYYFSLSLSCILVALIPPLRSAYDCIRVCTCVWERVYVDVDSSPAVLASTKALIWRIIQDSQGVLTHPSNTQGVHARIWGGGVASWGVKESPKISAHQGVAVKFCINICDTGPQCKTEFNIKDCTTVCCLQKTTTII